MIDKVTINEIQKKIIRLTAHLPSVTTAYKLPGYLILDVNHKVLFFQLAGVKFPFPGTRL